MKRTELERKLKRGVWKIAPGGKHNHAEHPDRPGEMIPVPNGSNIKEPTAKRILKEAGLL